MTERSGPGVLAALTQGFEGTGPAVSFEVEGEERELPSEVELVLYRTLQEGLTNALKHAQARRVFATLAFKPGGVRLSVTDDGEGAPEAFSEGGFGLRSLEERARSLGGVLKAANVPEGGFGLEVWLPTGGVA